jgi:ribosomal protein S18 acetylase RimI-like enzyme
MNAPLPGSNLVLRPLVASDLPSVARTHIDAFKDSALTKLGSEAVRLYYQWQLEGPHQVVPIAATYGDQLAGFGFGGVFKGAMSGYLRKNRSFLIRCAVRHPSVLIGRSSLTRVRSAFKRSPSGPANAENPPSFGVLAVATHPDYQKQGVGTKIMKALESEASERGFVRMHLSVLPANLDAVRFYEGLGWYRVLTNEEWRGSMEKVIRDE